MAEEIVELLRRIGPEAILALEKRDPQYLAICKLCRARGEEDTARLAMLNALVSYRLAGKGEEHWEYFAEFFSRRRSRDICEEFLEYLKASPYLALARNAKIKRTLKACRYEPDLEDLTKTWRDLAALVGADTESKTIVFAIKILNYVYICCRGTERLLPMEIPIPVDYRVAKLSACLGLIRASPEEALRRAREVQEAWNKVAKESGIPPLHIDTLLWLAGRAVLYGDRDYGIPADFLTLVKRFCH
ncbi:MAG: N-glycosylase/DNA lyase [Thermoproteus sp.]